MRIKSQVKSQAGDGKRPRLEGVSDGGAVSQPSASLPSQPPPSAASVQVVTAEVHQHSATDDDETTILVQPDMECSPDGDEY